VLRLGFGGLAAIAIFGVATEQWLGILFSLGVIGFAITFALQQPLLSLLGWFYIMTQRPYGVGDRVRIGETKGDVIEVDFLVTTIWEVGGELVSTNQPSGRVVTVPNSMVLSSDITNFGGGGSEYVWNELSMQVSYETDLDLASTIMIEEADEVIGEEMVDRIADFRERLAEGFPAARNRVHPLEIELVGHVSRGHHSERSRWGVKVGHAIPFDHFERRGRIEPLGIVRDHWPAVEQGGKHDGKQRSDPRPFRRGPEHGLVGKLEVARREEKYR
jgi:small-conductance mechanosensitive channel